MRAGRALGAFVAAVCLLATAGPVADASPPVPGTHEHPCEVGGPPAWYYSRTPPGVQRLSPTVTLACGRRLVGKPYEIVAVDTSEGLWVYADSGPLGYSEGQGARPNDPFAPITVQRGWSAPPSRTHIFGVLQADVASVEVVFHHRGQRKRVSRTPTTALVSGDLLTELHQTEPFGAYALTIPGCVHPRGIRVIAFNAEGRRIGSARPPTFLAHPCNPKTWFNRRQGTAGA